MKYFSLISFFLFTLLFAMGCRKESDAVETDRFFYSGAGWAWVNDDSLEFRVSMSKIRDADSLYSIGLDYYNQAGFLRKTISAYGFRMVFEKQTGYSIVFVPDSFPYGRFFLPDTLPYMNFYTSLSDGDAQGNSYRLNETDDIEDYIQVTYYDPATRLVKGELQASFIIDPTLEDYRPDPSSPDTIIIRRCVFEAKIKN